MRIDPASGLPIDPTTGRVAGATSPPPASKSDPAANGGQDQAHISSDAQQLSRYASAVNNTPEIRQEQVDEVRNALSAGTYSVSNTQIADAILQEQSRLGPEQH